MQTVREEIKINHKKIKYASVTIVLALIACTLLYLSKTPGHYFRSPLGIPTEIAGTFGEVRKDHFHTGIDIRTGGMENIPVYAMADGFIYRASIQRDGYGKALYISYKNGLMSIYAHLNSFSDEVTTEITKQQALSEQWEQEMFFSPKMFPVKKGTLVAYSGNSGFSEGPHLHLELRNAYTKTILNPVLAGISVNDNKAPLIRSVWLYNGSRSIYEESGNEIKFNPAGKYNMADPVIVADSIVRIGIEANDKNDQSKFRLGIYHAQLLLDNKPAFEFKMDSIPSTKERYVNATIDYARYFYKNRIIQFLFRLPGNHLPGYQQFNNFGLLRLTEGRTHRITIHVRDVSGNSKSISFRIRYKTSNKNKAVTQELLIPGMPHKVSKGSVVVYFSPLAFYDKIPFRMTESETKTAGSVSKTIQVHDPAVPVHTRYRIQLKTMLHKNDPQRKYVLMEFDNGKTKKYVKGDWKGDYMDGSFDAFGTIRLIVDNFSPRISPVKQNLLFDHGEFIRLECSDNAGFIDNFTARIDGQWAPFEQKKNSYHFLIARTLKKGNHCLEIEIGDIAGNVTRKKIDFIVK